MNISISEIILVLVIALLVIKPEQLPEVALNVGRFAKMLRHLLTQMKSHVNDFIASTEFEQSSVSSASPIEKKALPPKEPSTSAIDTTRPSTLA